MTIALTVAGCGSSKSARRAACSDKVDDSKPATITYKATGPATAQQLNATRSRLCERLTALDVPSAKVTVQGQNVVVTVAQAQAGKVDDQLGRRSPLQFYDWEPNVLGPDCKPPVPADVRVTVTPIIGKENALKRAARCSGKVRVLQAELPPKATPEIKANWDQWYVIKDNPALGGDQITHPEQNFDQGDKQPTITFGFTPAGRQAFQTVTRAIAQRGADADPTLPAQARDQHFAIAFNDQIVSLPYIDFQQNPDGIDGSTGAQITGGFTVKSAQALADFLKVGPLPVELVLANR